MESLKAMYEKDETVTLQELMNKLKELKVKKYHELLTIMNKMMSIFKKMEIAKVPLSENEKIDYMLGAMTDEQKLIFIPNTTSSEILYQDIKAKYKLLYHVGRINKSKNLNEHENMMDIDLINNIINKNKRKYKNKISKYFHICKLKNHDTDECYYNTKNQSNKRKNYNNFHKPNHNYSNNNNKNKSNFYNNNDNRNKNKNQFNYANRERNDIIYSDSEEEIYNNSNDILYINNMNIENKSKKKNIISWIYDTGASEHITNNKSILTDFINKQITMKCANNSDCTFQGYGTYLGKINNKIIKLEKVYYSKDITKNLISGIKLSQSNIICEINNYLNKPQLTLTYKNDIILKTYANKHNNFLIKTKNTLKNKKIFNLEKSKNFEKVWHNRLGHYYN